LQLFFAFRVQTYRRFSRSFGSTVIEILGREVIMRYLKYMALLAVLMVPLAYSQAQVRVGIGVGPVGFAVGPGYAAGPPVCDYGYYDYYPYDCAPYGYYGPQWFSGGIFIGAGPWYHGYYGRGWDRGYYGRAGWGRGYYGHEGWDRGRGYAGRGYYGGDRGFHGVRGGGELHAGNSFHGSGSHGEGGFHGGGGGGGFHGGGSHGGGHR
jgi:uncharacterized membrane protein YgcG